MASATVTGVCIGNSPHPQHEPPFSVVTLACGAAEGGQLKLSLPLDVAKQFVIDQSYTLTLASPAKPHSVPASGAGAKTPAAAGTSGTAKSAASGAAASTPPAADPNVASGNTSGTAGADTAGTAGTSGTTAEASTTDVTSKPTTH
jgi:hypothetical protein